MNALLLLISEEWKNFSRMPKSPKNIPCNVNSHVPRKNFGISNAFFAFLGLGASEAVLASAYINMYINFEYLTEYIYLLEILTLHQSMT